MNNLLYLEIRCDTTRVKANPIINSFPIYSVEFVENIQITFRNSDKMCKILNVLAPGP